MSAIYLWRRCYRLHSSFSLIIQSRQRDHKGLDREEQNKFSKKTSCLQWGWTVGPLVIRSDAYLTDLMWLVLIE